MDGDRLEELEKMDKLLLRAQVLQQDTLETLQKTVAAHDAWIREARMRDTETDQRIGALVSAIGALTLKLGELR